MRSLALSIAVVAVSALGTAMARAYALRRRLLDEPGPRRSHEQPMPRGGGAGPVLALLLALAWPTASGFDASTAAMVAAALLLVAFVGGWDDHGSLAARWRFLAHIVAGACVAFAFFDPVSAPVAFAAALAMVVVLVNVWNFMDGINGLAASQAVLFGVSILVLAPAAAGWGRALALACLGFLPFNFPRARVFLGDVGSGPLGLAVAVAWIAAAEPGPEPTRALVNALPASAFLVDAGLTLVRRVLRRERWWEAHTQHLYQSLARRHGHAIVTVAYGAWTLAAIAVARVASVRGMGFMMASVAVWYTSAAVVWLAMQRGSATRGAR